MRRLFLNPAQIVTVNTNGVNYKRGREMNDLSLLFDHSILTENNLIKDFIPNNSVHKCSCDSKISLKDKTVLPGLIDCHTHLVFAGSRANEFKQKLNGATYEEIARKGGGINKTVSSVKKSSAEELVKISSERINLFARQGVTTIEIKSGYGLDFENEIKILEAIRLLRQQQPVEIVPTFLGAHTFPGEYKNDRKGYIDIIIKKMLPFIAANKLAVFCDAFCEDTAFNTSEIDAVFSSAKSHGFSIKLHTEQFNNIGGIDTAIKYNAASIDHLEVIKKEDIKKISSSGSVAVLLPGVSFFLDYGFAPAKDIISSDAIVALASDYNPGSCNISNISMIMGIAALKMKLSVEEIISAFTINAAKALNISSRTGSIELNKQADFAVFNTVNYADIIYHIGENLNCMTIKNGDVIYQH